MTPTTTHTILAAFRNSTDAKAAADDLTAAGFPRDQISVEGEGLSSASSGSTKHPHEGGIKGWFKSIFGEEEHADRSRYENAYRQGRSLLRVDVSENDIERVEAILNRHSPINLQEDDLQEDDLQQDNARAGTADRKASTATEANNSTIPIAREEMQIGKRRILRGGARVYARIVTEPVQESISLQQERLRVDRRTVDREATEADFIERDEVIEVQEFAEEPVIAKRARVVEEVRVGKDVTEDTQTIRDSVRRTEVEVERTPQGTAAVSDDPDFRSDFDRRYASTGASYDTYEPGYQYGYTMASDPRYQGRSYDEVEPDLRSGYENRHPGGTWEKIKDSVRYGWEKTKNKAKAATR
jgi:uncharacterized protein (TIGR02271 family)